MNRIELGHLIEFICKRPAMNTVSGTFFENVCFLEGIAKGGLDKPFSNNHVEFTVFLQWYCKRMEGDCKSFGWREFRETFASDAEAFEKFPNLYVEFLETFEKFVS